MYPEHIVNLGNGATLRWRCEYDDSCRLECYRGDGSLIALEGFDSGFHLMTDGTSWRATAAFDGRCVIERSDNGLAWRREYPEHGVAVSQQWRRLDGMTMMFTCRAKALRKVLRPHLSYGLRILAPPYFPRFSYAHSPTQMGYSFRKGDGHETLWMVSLPPQMEELGKWSGCQALVAENPDPATLEFHLRLPPGYVAEAERKFWLEEGEVVCINGAISLRDGPFHDHAEWLERLLPREIPPRRRPLQNYVEMALDCFLDKRKFHPEGTDDGIIYYSCVDGTMDNPRHQYWTEGPSWGGACDAENSVNIIRCASLFPERKDMLWNHARRMLHGWLDNPRFRPPKGVFETKPGDFDEAYITTGWFPDCVWTIANADLMLRLAQLHLLTGWQECLPAAQRIAKWFQKRFRADGSVPTLWQFPFDYPPELGNGWRPEFSRCTRSGNRIQVLVEAQPAPCAFLASAFRVLAEADMTMSAIWNQLADRLMQWVVARIEPPLASFGNGECDYAVYRTESIDPTGIAYILCALESQYRLTPTDAIKKLVRRFADIFACFSVFWDCHETRLRPEEKCTMGPYGADIKMAGGIAHGNWQPVYTRGFGQRFNLLMNRNEIADGMLAAWKVTREQRDLDMLRAFVNWQIGFQFTNEVDGSPVSTKGSCQQNHFWTTDFGNWNNDYALTAFKWTGSLISLLQVL